MTLFSRLSELCPEGHRRRRRLRGGIIPDEALPSCIARGREDFTPGATTRIVDGVREQSRHRGA